MVNFKSGGFFGKIFDNPSAVFTEAILKPETQDQEVFVDGINNIAQGALGPAANFLERALARLLPAAIGFIANWVGLQDGEVNRAYSTVDLGAGIRVIKGDAQGFAYSEDLTEKALLSAAGTAASVADSTPSSTPSDDSERRSGLGTARMLNSGMSSPMLASSNGGARKPWAYCR